ncbi:hypothetical protein KI387_037716 [Taxus chinensis]|uniref:Conserved oligomeric Golgi complex subunit 7 n=1 Tax=Taxus chinensis TaxID=29808 RepID=A0AA38FTL0_TAXCH|nr:hypothetical protein KI387_037716 [Taxus chinensis]
MMVDLSNFSDERFDAKKWINGACKARHPEEPVEKHLADVEMKLQAHSEEIAASLDEQSSSALLRVPRASRDVIRVRDDAVVLRSAVSGILHKLKKAEGSSAESVAALARVDTVKQRMEAAFQTLKDAAGLTKLSASVEDVFSSGDLSQAAETLANMRHCLSVVGEVSEFANVKRQLEVLEDRLEGMVQPRLMDAISNRKVDAAQGLRHILIRIGRYKYLEQQYTKIRMKSLRRLWEDFDSGKGNMGISKVDSEKQLGERQPATIGAMNNDTYISFTRWLPQFYDEVLLNLEQEWKWCITAFPEEYKSLVPKLLVETMSTISTSFIARIDVAMGEASSGMRTSTGGLSDISFGENLRSNKIKTKHMERLIELHNMTGAFAKNIHHLFAVADMAVLANTLRAIYSPYESYKQRYGDLELTILSAEISNLDLRGAVPRGVGAQGVELSETVRRMEESVPQVIVLLEASVERCISFTGGSEAEALIRTLDDTMLQYLAMLHETLKSLRSVCGVDQSAHGDLIGAKKETGSDKREVHGVNLLDMVSDEEEWSIVQGALQMLTVADSLSSRSSVFEASLRASLARLNTTLQISNVLASIGQTRIFGADVNGSDELSKAGAATFDMAALRLIDAPEKARRLSNLLEQAKDPRFHALPHTSQRVGAFSDAVNELVYEVLILKIRYRLKDVSRMAIWTLVEEDNAFSLPSFSAYPQPYITSIGEYLLTLPQQLEPLALGGGTTGLNTHADASTDEAQFFATEWMFKVAEGATTLYIEQLRGIQSISDRGAQQLSADIEYLCNVLSALSKPTPPVLATFHNCLTTSREQLRELVKSDTLGQLDMPTARLVCKMRHVASD